MSVYFDRSLRFDSNLILMLPEPLFFNQYPKKTDYTILADLTAPSIAMQGRTLEGGRSVPVWGRWAGTWPLTGDGLSAVRQLSEYRRQTQEPGLFTRNT